MKSPTGRVRVYLACSLDGFIAGPDDDLSWLTEDRGAPEITPPPEDGLGFEAFLAQVGSMLMGRRTHDVVAGMGHWAYGELPVLVATRRPLEPAHHTVRAVSGDIAALVAEALAVAGGEDVYLDGGDLVRQALDAGLVDEMVITMIPVLLTAGVRLFDGLVSRQKLEFVGQRRLAPDMIQLTIRVRR